MAGPHHIVFANEKGGTGKSTTAVHVAIALASRGARVACIDLDSRQRTLHRYLENRRDTMKRRGVTLPMPEFEVFEHESLATLEKQIERLGRENDFLVFDTPGRDDKYARFVATRANTLVTPINDSFVDFDLIGQVDAENFKVRKLSFYAELIWEARKERAKADGVTIDWVVVRNRLHNMEARNQQRMTDAIAELSKRVGFRSVPGLNERVIYRELFPSGLTLIDKGHLGQLATAHIVARQELRELVTGLALPELHSAALVLMGPIVILIIAALGWAVWKGKLRAQQLPPILVGIAGAFIAARGNLLLGVAAIGIAITWYRGLTWRLFGTQAKQSDQYAVDKARFMLGVSRFDNEQSIRERHAALIAKNHPDTGGSNERAQELNAARDLLLRDLRDKAS